MTAVAEAADPHAEGIDEDLGSPIARSEHAWLMGIAVALVVLVLFARRRARKRRSQDSPDNLYR
jgi:hypothetical protein